MSHNDTGALDNLSIFGSEGVLNGSCANIRKLVYRSSHLDYEL